MNTVEAPVALGWWLYGVVDAAAPVPEVPGLGERVDAVVHGRIAALVDRVDLADFGEEPARTNLEDAVWLERNVRAHEAVLERALAGGAVVPFRFLTVYEDETALRRFLGEHEQELAEVLESVRGTVELGVKAFVDEEAFARALAARSAGVAELESEAADAGTGRAYLLGRKRDQLAREEGSRVLAAFAADAHERLAAAALGAVVAPLQPPQLSGRSERMILNGAYLVRAGDDTLERVLHELSGAAAELGIALEQTGPWPPYNFVPRDLGAA